MPVVVELCWNNPSCPQCPPGFICKIKAIALRLSHILKSCPLLLFFVSEMIYDKKTTAKQKRFS